MNSGLGEGAPMFDLGSPELARLHADAKRGGNGGRTYQQSITQIYWVRHRSMDPRHPDFRVLQRIGYNQVVPATINEQVMTETGWRDIKSATIRACGGSW